jgi:hypothetical protein
MHVNLAGRTYTASIPRMVGKFPDNVADELWISNFKTCTPGGDCQVFREVMFVDGAAFLFGIEHEDSRPRCVKAELAERKKLLIDL